MNQSERKTKPELWEEIKHLQKKISTLELFLQEKGILEEAMEYLDEALQDMEELPFD